MQFSTAIPVGDAGEAAPHDDVQSSVMPHQPWQALCLLARLHHIAADPDSLMHGRGLSRNSPVSDGELLGSAKQFGLKAKISRTQADRISMAPLPALARLADDNGGGRWVLLAQCDGQRVLFQDPLAEGGGRPTIEPIEVFLRQWAPSGSGDLMLATSRASLAGALAGGTKLIQPLEASVVKAIHVKDGDKVQAVQVLIELDPTSAQADNSRVSQERSGALSEAWRTHALLAALRERGAKAPVLPEDARQASNALSSDERELMRSQLDAEWRYTQAQLARLQADIDTRQAELQTVKEQIEKLQATLPIVRKREDDFQTLHAQGFVSQHAGQDRTQARIEMERDLATQRARLVEVKAAIAQAEHNHAAWRSDALKTLSERHAKADLQARSLQAEGAKTSQREQLTTLRAPVTGTVQQRAVHTTGGVVTPAQVLMVVVPDAAQVTAEVTLENKDVGFVHLGQEAAIKLETFPFTRYGTVEAKVTTITADAVMKEPGVQADKEGEAIASGGAVFPATLTLAANAIDVDGKAIRLTPGMNLTAEIKTGKRRVIEYLLSPVQSHASESLKER